MALRKKTYEMFTKSSLPSLFRRYGVDLDVAKYTAAAHVFPMRINNHVAEDLIDWQVSTSQNDNQVWGGLTIEKVKRPK